MTRAPGPACPAVRVQLGSREFTSLHANTCVPPAIDQEQLVMDMAAGQLVGKLSIPIPDQVKWEPFRAFEVFIEKVTVLDSAAAAPTMARRHSYRWPSGTC